MLLKTISAFKFKIKPNNLRTFSTNNYKHLKPPWKVLFFGTDNFSLASLKALNLEYCRNNNFIEKLEIVTSEKNKIIKKFAEENNLLVHNWPLLKLNESFHIGLVVSFGHLIPKHVIDYFPMGMLNVHASLLPRWRGAAPIIYALINGDKKTGVSIMRIMPEKFDVGDILRQEEIEIGPDMKMLELHEKLAEIGAFNLIEALKSLPSGLDMAKPQSTEGITFAPKIDVSMSKINFVMKTALEIYNLSRGLTGLYPLSTNWNGKMVKIHNVVQYDMENKSFPGFVEYDKKRNLLQVGCREGCIYIDKIGISNKKVMSASEFNNGYVKKAQLDRRKFE